MMTPHANAIMQELVTRCSMESLVHEAKELGMDVVGEKHISIRGSHVQWDNLQEVMYGTAKSN